MKTSDITFAYLTLKLLLVYSDTSLVTSKSTNGKRDYQSKLLYLRRFKNILTKSYSLTSIRSLKMNKTKKLLKRLLNVLES
jgi:hypothetical protein